LTAGKTFNNAYDFQKEGPIMANRAHAADFVTVGDSTGETVSLLIHKQIAESDHSDDTTLYQLAKSPIRFNKVEESLINYPRKYEAI
jgi:hypothetical protein